MTDASSSIDLGRQLRALRRRADLSQRELASLAGVPQATLARIEAGRSRDPKFRTVERLVRAAGGAVAFGTVAVGPRAVAVGPVADDTFGPYGGSVTEITPVPHDGMRDEAGRHYPAHLDVREVNDPKDWAGAWWAHWYNLPPERWPLRVPDATYDLSRERRDRRRWREEVRGTVRLRRVIADLPGGACQWVAELPDGRLVGELRAHRRAERPYYDDLPGWPGQLAGEIVLDGVVVASDCRRLGIGRRLIDELAAEMDRAGIAVARALTEYGEIGFLVACGFQVEAARPARLALRRP